MSDGEHAIFNLNDSEFFGKVIAVHWAKNSQKQALLGKSKAVWHHSTQQKEGRQQQYRKSGGAAADSEQQDQQEPETVVVNN